MTQTEQPSASDAPSALEKDSTHDQPNEGGGEGAGESAVEKSSKGAKNKGAKSRGAKDVSNSVLKGVPKGAKRLHLAREAVARFKKAGEEGREGNALSLTEAVSALYATPRAKFDETLEVAMNLGIDPRHADQQVRGTVSLPHGTGKTLRVAVFARDEKAEQARKAGADIVGAEDLAERVQKGELPFDRCIATPDMMGLVGRLGKILGPRNLMPNPKLGTVAANVTAAVEAAKGGEVQFRAEKNGVVHAGVGRMSFSESQLQDNVLAFTKTVVALKPEGAKGTYVKKITLSTTMGLGVGVDVRSVASA